MSYMEAMVISATMRTLTDYELRHLVSHLRSANRTHDIHTLLATTDSKGKNLWFVTKEQSGDADGYAGDLRDALTIALAGLRSKQQPSNADEMQRVLRYSLALSTLNGFAANIPAPVLSELVRRNVWRAGAAFDYAKRTPQPAQRINSLSAVFPFLDDISQQNCLTRFLESVQELGSVSGNESMLMIHQAEALTRMGQALLESRRHDFVHRLCLECRLWPSGEALVFTVATLLTRIPEPASKIAAQCAHEWYRQTTDPYQMVSLLSLLNDDEREECLEICVETLRTPALPSSRSVELLKTLQTSVSSSIFRELLADMYRRLTSAKIPTQLRLTLLAELGAFLSPKQQGSFINEASGVIRDAQWADVELQKFILRIIDVPSFRQPVIDAVNDVSGDYMRAQLLCETLVGRVLGDQERTFARVMELAVSYLNRGNTWESEEILYSLSKSARFLSAESRYALLEAVKEITDQKLRLRAETELFPFMSAQTADPIVTGEVKELNRIDNPDVIDSFCKEGARVVSTNLLSELPQMLRDPREHAWFLLGIERIMPHITDVGLQRWALEVASRAPDPIGHYCVLAMAKHLLPDVEVSAFKVAKHLEKPSYRIECCSLILKVVRNPDLIQELTNVIHTALEGLTEPGERADALVRLLNIDDTLPSGHLVDDALQSIARINNPTTRAELLASTGRWAGLQGEDMKRLLVEESFTRMREAAARDVLKAIAPSLDCEQAYQIVRRLEDLWDDNARREAMPQMIARIARDGQLEEAIAFALKQPNEIIRGDCLYLIAPYLTQPILASTLPAYRAIANKFCRDRAVSAICVRAAQLHMNNEVAGIVHEIENSVERAGALCALSMSATDLEKRAYLNEALQAFKNSNEHLRTSVIQPLANSCAELEGSDLTDLFGRLIEIMVTENRERLLPQSYALVPVFNKFIGPLGANLILAVVQEVTQWWP